jgi:hypothetical protein
MSDCQGCRSDACPGGDADYYPFAAVRFCRPQMLWLILNMEIIADGRWPPEGKSTGYIDPIVGNTGRKAEAGFTRPVQIAAEVRWRLTRTRSDGETLYDEVSNGLEEYHQLSRAAKNALNYISGWRRRRQGYASWCADRKRNRITAGRR